MSIYDPYGIYPNVSVQDMTIVSSEGINVIWGDNPEFSPSDFLNFLPEFTGLVEIEKPYNVLFKVYAVLASSELSEKRFNDVWKYVMSLYIAHKLTVRFGTLVNVKNLTDTSAIMRQLAAAKNFVASSESVGGVSVSYDVGATLAMGTAAGDWNRTQYGQELATMLKVYGAISVWITGI